GYDPVAHRVFPLRSWRRKDVYRYLEARKIPLPDGLGRKEQGGLDFHPGALATLKRERPDDYRKWLRDFPFSGVQLTDQDETIPVGHDTEQVAPVSPDSIDASKTAPRQKDQTDLRQSSQGSRRPKDSRKRGRQARRDRERK